MDGLTDADLLAAWCAGDRDAFAILVSRHYGLVHSACRRQAASAEVEDCTQAVFLVLARRPTAARRAPVLAAWLQRTAWFVCKHSRRAAQRRRQVEGAAAALRQDHAGQAPEALDHLDDCLLKLPERQRAAVTLHYLTGKSAEEVATALGTSRDNAYLLVSRGLAGLRVLLARRGVAMAGGGLLSVLATQAQAATAPAPAAILATLSGTPAVGATTLATGAMTAMTITTITPFAAAAGLLLTLGTTAVLLTAEPTPVAPAVPPPTPAEPAPAAAEPAPVAPKPGIRRVFVPDGAPAAPWNDMDTKVSANDLAEKILADPWLATFIQGKQRNPKLQPGRIVVRADGETIQTSLLLDKVQRALFASGKIMIIVPEENPSAAPGGTAPVITGDVLLNGSLTLERSTQGRRNLSFYTVTLTGTDISSRQLLFSVETKLRKSVDLDQFIESPNPPPKSR